MRIQLGLSKNLTRASDSSRTACTLGRCLHRYYLADFAKKQNYTADPLATYWKYALQVSSITGLSNCSECSDVSALQMYPVTERACWNKRCGAQSANGPRITGF